MTAFHAVTAMLLDAKMLVLGHRAQEGDESAAQPWRSWKGRLKSGVGGCGVAPFEKCGGPPPDSLEVHAKAKSDRIKCSMRIDMSIAPTY
jgi:hypothetical protein